MSNEFRQVDLMIGDAQRRRTTERKLQISEQSYAAGGDGFLCGATAWSWAKPFVSLAMAVAVSTHRPLLPAVRKAPQI
jgi:hypothetical protein